MLMNLKGVSVEKIFESFADCVNKLRALNITDDEILSDITYTILVCKKDFDKSKGNFFRYLYKSLENNFNRKIYAIKMKNLNECELTYDIPVKKDSPISEAISECPELFEYALGKINDNDIDKKYLDTLEDYF